MSYKQVKWLILFLPTVVVGLWEYIRHQFLMPVLSMDAGNMLTPVLVFLVSVTLLRRLFAMLERMQRELEQARSVKANLEAREELARELHDGIAQSLFLLSVKLDRMERRAGDSGLGGELGAVRRTVREVDRYVRQALANLREPKARTAPGSGAGTGSGAGSSAPRRGPETAVEAVSAGSSEADQPAEESMAARVGRLAEEAMIDVAVDWSLPDESLASREKAELLACIREAVINVRKHAHAAHAQVTGRGSASGWTVEVADDGRGFDGDPLAAPGRYGLKIMADRAQEMGWRFELNSKPGRTSVRLGKGEEPR
ncbi:sensor histidine kinase [Saccharibacillus alkalitolerans]|uniref:histidine kinase n=1 Tax=Saccharibacillus alkalitolerans TaxID=2705290 RepID=A0ABX0F9Z7_9BACL|nr:histidine kinase [Saccharibacillus alkalitolerans]NGZ77766.1 two-component sensor histidine kinase [Saccharibacillus alkalitolerans]